jgi:uncharacterized repeat protein (TIGR01451 family)
MRVPRRWCGTCAAIAVAAFAALVIATFGAGAARAAVTLPSGPTPLPGSTFQGADGNQEDAPPYTDWQGLQQAGRVVHNPDSGLQFGPGSKEDNPGGWSLVGEGTGVNPPKDNIYDAWSAIDQTQTDTFLYLGFTREAGNGTTTIAFELNQDARTWDNGQPGTPQIPCRRTGDVLVVFDAHGDDTTVDVHLERWVTETTDPASGCASTGHLDALATTTIPAGSGQGSTNPGPITSRLPGHFPPGTQIPDPRLFGEAALNLTKLFDTALGSPCFSFASIWMHSRASEPETAEMKDYLAPEPITLNSCVAAGTKFLDLNANGQRDAGEPGLPGFVIWADYNNDGVLDVNKEPYTVTDSQGHYVLKGIRPPNGTYTLRETLITSRRVRGATAWRCSFPNDKTPGSFANGPGGLFGCGWGPIPATTPFAQDLDFGNWLPAQLTVEKELWPADDPGRFDLKVNGQTVLPAAGDGATTTLQLVPGSYDVTEQAAPGTDPAAYRSTVTCQPTTRRRGRLRAGTGYLGLVLRAGDHATCTFTNVRPGSPAIAIAKDGPTLALAGDTLRYTLSVTNPGDVPFPADSVHVADPVCDAPPALVGKAGSSGADNSPGTLDPGDTWTYQCSNKTQAPGATCTLSTVKNTATATGGSGDAAVSDEDSLTTTLNCPDQPPQPPLPEPTPPGPTPPPNPGPSPPAAGLPAVPTPPPAGQDGIARLLVVGRARCITHASQVRLLGTHITDVHVSVDGRVVRRQTLRILQRTATPLGRLVAPGRHRVTLRVSFELGSATAPVTLTRTIAVCALAARRPPPRRAPPVTG